MVDGRYRFRHELVRHALAAGVPPHRQVSIHRDAARRLERSGAPPALIARHWLDGKRPDDAIPWSLAAGRHALRLGAYEDALVHLDSVLAHAPTHVEALRLSAQALDALGRGGAPAAYAAAAEVVVDGADDLRAQQALAQLKLGDFAGALGTVDGLRPATLDGRLAQALTLSGIAAIGLIDPEAATTHAAESRRLALQLGDPAAAVAASWAQALAAHVCGQLRDSLRVDVRATASLPELAIAVFDGQLCVTQRLLYGVAPYAEVIDFADSLAAEAERVGAARGGAFARTLRGEALLLSGQLASADRELAAAGDLHRSISAPTGEAHALQRRAEIAVRSGRRADARRLIGEALHVARHSRVGFHLLDRIYGTAIEAADDVSAAMAVVNEAELAIRGPVETCPGCRITFAVPAAIATAQASDLARAEGYLAAAEMLATVVMQLPAWDAAVDEARGHIAREGRARSGHSHVRGSRQAFPRRRPAARRGAVRSADHRLTPPGTFQERRLATVMPTRRRRRKERSRWSSRCSTDWEAARASPASLTK